MLLLLIFVIGLIPDNSCTPGNQIDKDGKIRCIIDPPYEEIEEYLND